MFNKKGQGATEYLIILAVVIVVALIVVAAIGGIPGIGKGASKRASDAFWDTADIAIPAFAISAATDGMSMDVRNNQKNAIESLTVSVNGVAATCDKTKLASGQETDCTIAAVTTCDAGDAYSLNVSISYTDTKTNAAYTTDGDGHTLDGVCAS